MSTNTINSIPPKSISGISSLAILPTSSNPSQPTPIAPQYISKYRAKITSSDINLKDPALLRASTRLNLASLKAITSKFTSYIAEKSSSKQNQSSALNYTEFAALFNTGLCAGLDDDQKIGLFMRIDSNADGLIDYNDFMVYMLHLSINSTQSTTNCENLYQKSCVVGPKTINNANKNNMQIVKVVYNTSNDTFISCTRSGVINVYTSKMKLKLTHNIVVDCEIPDGCGAWVTDFVCAPAIARVIVACDDHSILFLDITTFEVYLNLDLWRGNALSMDFKTIPMRESTVKQNTPKSASASKKKVVHLLVFGTDEGMVFSVIVHDAVKQKLKTRVSLRKPATAVLSYFSVSSAHVHSGWVTNVSYSFLLNACVSCSFDSKYSICSVPLDSNYLIPVTTNGPLSYASVISGISTFAESDFHHVFVTGGVDKQVRTWNPRHLKNPVSTFIAHSKPIFAIGFDLQNRLITASIDSEIKVWDLQNSICLLRLSGKWGPELSVSAFAVFNEPHKNGAVKSVEFIIAETDLVIWTLPISSSAIIAKQVTQSLEKPVKSHPTSVTHLLFSPIFNQIISGCENGEFNIWDSVTGSLVFSFSTNCSSSDADMEVTASTLDSTFRKLIIGFRFGRISMYNFNNGQKIQNLHQETNTEVTCLEYIDMKGKNDLIVASGWGKKVTIFVSNNLALDLYPHFKFGESIGSVWHADDISALSFISPAMIASSSFSGDIIISNIDNGIGLHHLNHCSPPETPASRNSSIDILCVLDTRATIFGMAGLVSAGSEGLLKFWDTKKGILIYEHDCKQHRKVGIYKMCTNSSETIIYTGDSAGWVCAWDIRNAGGAGSDYFNDMPCTAEFRAHESAISGLLIVESSQTLVTCSDDCKVKMFTLKGECIGTMGQLSDFNVNEPSTYSFESVNVGSEQTSDYPCAIRTGAIKPSNLKLKRFARTKMGESEVAKVTSSMSISKLTSPVFAGILNTHSRMSESASLSRASSYESVLSDKPILHRESDWFKKSIYAHETLKPLSKIRAEVFEFRNGANADLKLRLLDLEEIPSGAEMLKKWAPKMSKPAARTRLLKTGLASLASSNTSLSTKHRHKNIYVSST